MDMINTIPWDAIFYGGVLGIFGGIARSLIGLKKYYSENGYFDVKPEAIGLNLSLGALAGSFGAGSGLLTDFIGLVAFGYFGADSIEGLFSKKK